MRCFQCDFFEIFWNTNVDTRDFTQTTLKFLYRIRILCFTNPQCPGYLCFFRDPRVVFLNINQNWLALERGCMKLGKVLLIQSLSKLAYGMLGQGTFFLCSDRSITLPPYLDSNANVLRLSCTKPFTPASEIQHP